MKMLSTVLTGLLLMSISAYSSDMTNMARKLLIQDIEKYSDDYGITDLLSVKNLGLKDGDYHFSVSYTKDFCKDVGDDSRLYCQIYQCESQARVSIDGNIDFETSKDSKSCLLIENSDY